MDGFFAFAVLYTLMHGAHTIHLISRTKQGERYVGSRFGTVARA